MKLEDLDEEFFGFLIDMQGATVRLAASCAAALSEAGIMPADRAGECAREMRRIARLQEDRIIALDGPPSRLAGQLNALAQIIEDRSKK